MASRGLLLDIGGVVLQTGSTLLNRYAEREPGVRQVIDSIGGIATERDELWQQMLRREISEREYWARRAAQLGAVFGQTWDTRAMISRLYDVPQDQWLQAGAVELMADAKAAGLPLGALTNDMGLFHGAQWVAGQSFLAPFDVIVDGSVTGLLKPDPFPAEGWGIGGVPADVARADEVAARRAAAEQRGS